MDAQFQADHSLSDPFLVQVRQIVKAEPKKECPKYNNNRPNHPQSTFVQDELNRIYGILKEHGKAMTTKQLCLATGLESDMLRTRMALLKRDGRARNMAKFSTIAAIWVAI
jgi:hypothetical protein